MSARRPALSARRHRAVGQILVGLIVALLMAALPGAAQAQAAAPASAAAQVSAAAPQTLMASRANTPRIDVVRVGRALNAVRARSGRGPLRYVSGDCQTRTAYAVMRQGRMRHRGCDNIQAKISNWNQLAPAWRASAKHHQIIKRAAGTASVGVRRDRSGYTYIVVDFANL